MALSLEAALEALRTNPSAYTTPEALLSPLRQVSVTTPNSTVGPTVAQQVGDKSTERQLWGDRRILCSPA
jgi:hypothetical protein